MNLTPLPQQLEVPLKWHKITGSLRLSKEHLPLMVKKCNTQTENPCEGIARGLLTEGVSSMGSIYKANFIGNLKANRKECNEDSKQAE